MITCVTKTGTCNGRAIEVCELYGLSGDTKPIDVKNGSVFMEMDTGKVSIFDEENKKWYEL